MVAVDQTTKAFKMLGNCVVIVGSFSLGYWINNEKWKLVRAYERALRARLQRIPSNQDVRINDTERKKLTIIQHRCGVTLMRAGHVQPGLTQLAMAVLASNNPAFLLGHYRSQLSPHLFQQLNERYRLFERTFEFKKEPCHCKNTAVGKATVGTQYTYSETEESETCPSRRARSEGLPVHHSRLRLQPLTTRSTQEGYAEVSASFELAPDASVATSRHKPPTEWESVSQCHKNFEQTSTRATKSTSSEDGYASSETSKAFTASSHVSDSGDWVASSLCSGCFDDSTTFITKSCYSDGMAPEISFPSAETLDLEEWFSSSSLAERFNEETSVIPPSLRIYCWRLLGLREEVLEPAQADDPRTINETVRRYCLDIVSAVRRTLLLFLYYSASG